MPMKSLKSHSIVLALGFVALTFSSCNHPTTNDPFKQINNSQQATVLGFNGATNAQSRHFSTYGALSQKTRENIALYISSGKLVPVNYTHPQYYIALDNTCWAICSDLNGNMTGIFAPVKGDAKKVSASSNVRLIVNDTEEGQLLAYEIMKDLEPADSYRKSVRKKQGLSTPTPIAPGRKPVIISTPSPVKTSSAQPQKKVVKSSEEDIPADEDTNEDVPADEGNDNTIVDDNSTEDTETTEETPETPAEETTTDNTEDTEATEHLES